MESRSDARSLARFLYNHNPFYVISACLLLYGLKLSIRPEEAGYIDPWMLAGALAGYTAVMSLTGWLVVRHGKVWEDARSIFLVILLMFLAGSVSLDELVNLYPARGQQLIWLSLAGVILLTETLLRTLRIQLPWIYRGPYYAWWTLCYLAPLALSQELVDLSILDVAWRMAAFPLLAGAIVLSLIPAVRRGPAAVANNGTPWSWPLYPWTLFVFLAVAVCFRSYALTISFLPFDGMQTAFCTYFLVPFALSVLVLLLEFGLQNGSQRFQAGVLATGAALLWLAVPSTGGDAASAAFLSEWTARLGSPLFLTAMSLAAFAMYGELRRAAGTDLLMTVALLALSVIGPQTIDESTRVSVQPLPLGLLAGWAALRGVQRQRSLEWLAAIVCGVGALSRLPTQVFFPGFYSITLYHAALVGTLVLAVAGRDRLARGMQVVTALWLPLSGWLAVQSGASRLACSMYLLLVVLLLVASWRLTHNRAYLLALGGMSVGGIGQVSWLGLMALVDAWGWPRTMALLGSAASFVVAAGISFIKASLRNPLASAP